MENAIITQTRFHRQINEDPVQAFTLIDMQTAFYIFGFGQLGCLCVFIGELLFYRRQKKLKPLNGIHGGQQINNASNRCVSKQAIIVKALPNQLFHTKSGPYHFKTYY